MKIVSRNKYIIFLLLLLAGQITAQPVSVVNVIVAGSDGNDAVKIKGSESDLNDLAGYIRSAFGGKIRNELILPLSKQEDRSCLQKITTVFNACDSNDILITVWIGPWTANPRNASAANFLNVNEPMLTVDYVLNAMRLMPSRTSFNFIVAPERYSFPIAMVKEYPRSAASGGRHLLLVSARERMSYVTMVERFIGAMEKMKEWKLLDANRDGRVLASEWLIGLERRALEEKINLTPYWLEPGSDIPMLQVPK
jgi:hypothetical protein